MPEPRGRSLQSHADEGDIRSDTSGIRRTDHGQSPSVPPGQRLWGTRPGRLGVFTVIAGAFAGFVITALAGREPGFILGLLVVLATVVAVFAVRPKAAYLVIPAPALAYVVAAVLTGYLHDRSMDTSHTALAISAVQWTASGFVPMFTATAIAVVVTAVRWWLARRRTPLRYGGATTRHGGATSPQSAADDPGTRLVGDARPGSVTRDPGNPTSLVPSDRRRRS